MPHASGLPLSSWSPTLQVLFGYTLFASVVLVNLLIAMFSETYNRVMRDSDSEYKVNRTLPSMAKT